MNHAPIPGHGLYASFAGIGALLFFLGPALALLTGTDALLAASIGYGGIAMFVGGIAARFSFAVAAHPVMQLLKNLAVALLFTGFFYGIFLLFLLM